MKNQNINWANLIILLITSKKIRYWFQGTLFYAINNYEENRGTGASDVLMFNVQYSNKIFFTLK